MGLGGGAVTVGPFRVGDTRRILGEAGVEITLGATDKAALVGAGVGLTQAATYMALGAGACTDMAGNPSDAIGKGEFTFNKLYKPDA